jgi:hypothetical protein
MIGWYVHHHGAGHLYRARAVMAVLERPATVLSSLPRPEDWEGPWVELAGDDGGAPRDPDAAGFLHWAPFHHDGLRSRMADISAWIAWAQPELMVCDVSVEVAVLARLHGVPVVCVAMPGDRSDAPHRLAYGLATGLVGCWPPGAHGDLEGLPEAEAARIQQVGGLSRFPVAQPRPRRSGPPRVTLLQGAGGSELSADVLECATAETPQWEWTVLGGDLGVWREDPFNVICDADVVVTHAGENAVAEVAAARRPAVVVPGKRPHGEQEASARALERGPWPALVHHGWPTSGWSQLLAHAARLDGADWASWCDGGAARRFADALSNAVSVTSAGAP